MNIKELLAPIRERLERAAPGPWMYFEEYLSYGPSFVRRGDVIGTVQIFSTRLIEDEDAQLIAHAPSDLSLLIEAVTVLDDAFKKIPVPHLMLCSTVRCHESCPVESRKQVRARVAEIVKGLK